MTRSTAHIQPVASASRLAGPGRAVAFVGDDEALVDALRAGNSPAIAAFYDRFSPHVMRILGRILGACGELEDVHHDAFVRALDAVHDLRDPCALHAWMTSIAVMSARRWLQRRARRSWLRFLPDDEVPEPHAPPPDDEARAALAAVYAVLNEMPTEERIVLSLRLIENMDLTAVARASGVSLATVKRRLNRAESRFVLLARRRPALQSWLEGGSRWASATQR